MENDLKVSQKWRLRRSLTAGPSALTHTGRRRPGGGGAGRVSHRHRHIHYLEAGRTSREASLHAAASVCCTAGRRNHCKETEADRRRDITDLTHLSR